MGLQGSSSDRSSWNRRCSWSLRRDLGRGGGGGGSGGFGGFLALPVAWWAVAASPLVYLSTLSLGGDARIEYRPWELESALFVVTCGVISAVVVVVVVAGSAVSWHFRWPGGL